MTPRYAWAATADSPVPVRREMPDGAVLGEPWYTGVTWFADWEDARRLRFGQLCREYIDTADQQEGES